MARINVLPKEIYQLIAAGVLRSACRPVGITSVLGGVCVGLAGAVRLAVGMTGVGALVRAVLELVCAVWLIRLGRSWTHKG